MGAFERVIAELLQPERLERAMEVLIAIVLIVVGARVLMGLLRAVLRQWLGPSDPRRADRHPQFRTLLPLIESGLRYVIYFATLIMILDQLRVNIVPLLASASVVGIALGLGAQQFIRDVIGGFFLLFEGLVQVGDVVSIGEVTGEVERISLRATQVRKYSGELVTIPNGRIQQIGNMNRGFMRAIVQLGVAYEAGVDRAMAIMEEAGREWAAAHPGEVLAPPEVHGIMGFGTDHVSIRLVLTVAPGAYVRAERELRLRVKAAFDAEGIERLSPSRVVSLQDPPASGAPAPGA